MDGCCSAEMPPRGSGQATTPTTEMCKNARKRFPTSRNAGFRNSGTAVSILPDWRFPAARIFSKNASDYSEQHDLLKETKNGKEYKPNKVAQALYFIIKDANELKPRELIDKLRENEDFKNVSYGSLQKLVNMTLKYLFILQELKYLENKEYVIPHINEKDCDCPLDSIILGSINEHSVKWTSIEPEKYQEIEKRIERSECAQTRLEYDFKKWPNYQTCPWSHKETESSHS